VIIASGAIGLGVVLVGVLAFALGRSTNKASTQTNAGPPTVASTIPSPTTPLAAAAATSPPEPTTTGAPDPSVTVETYYEAVAQHDYQRAWNLGGMNLVSSYQTFVAGYAATDHEQLTVTGTSGSRVDVQLIAYEYDRSGGQQKSWYAGSYQVANGVITAGQLRLLARTTGW
jgi:hypothetical protein